MRWSKVLLFLSVLLASLASAGVFAYSQQLEEHFQAAGISLEAVAQQPQLSRYEVARLLSVVECEDCLVPSPWMKKQYHEPFWNAFASRSDFYFRDIGFEAAPFNQRDYYYCAAYVADHDYLRGYPPTSSLLKCKNKFCGSQTMSKSEFFQSLLNIVDDQLYARYLVNRKEIKNWLTSLRSDSYAYKTLSPKDVQTIQQASVSRSAFSQTRALQSLDEFQAYLKYCMFNLQACNFQEVGGLKQGWWPIAELNILIQAGFVQPGEVQDLQRPIAGKQALQLLEYLSDHFVRCEMDEDYDCDGIHNAQDNCPYAYNLQQADLNANGVGDVCDAYLLRKDQKNAVPLVDDHGYVIIKNWNSKDAPALLDQLHQGFGFFITTTALGEGSPFRVSLKAMADSDLRQVQWDMGDGKRYTLSSSQLSHTYTAPGWYVIHAVGTNQAGKTAEASTRIFIAPQGEQAYALHLQPSFTFTNGGVQYHFDAQKRGNIDTISWSLNGRIMPGSLTRMSTLLTQEGLYLVRAKAYAQGKLVAVAETTVRHARIPSFARLQLQSSSSQYPVSVATTLPGVNATDVLLVEWNWGDGTIDSSMTLSARHQYQTAGVKTLQQMIRLRDGSQLLNTATFFIQNPLTQHSLALNIRADRLSYAQKEPLDLWVKLFPSADLPFLSSLPPQTFWSPSYDSMGNYQVGAVAQVNRCVGLFTKGQVHIKKKDLCLDALIKGTLKQFRCDLDHDGVPDLCDEDIDGDGVPNLLGLFRAESADCSLHADNLDIELLNKHFGVCSLDNCPFSPNQDQKDLNHNGRGDSCESLLLPLIWNQLSSPASQTVSDQAFDVEGSLMDRALSALGGKGEDCDAVLLLSCGNGKIEEGENCQTCPEDVGMCTSICGNGIVELGETCHNCPADLGNCGKKLCGNGIIDETETCATCPQDLRNCPPRQCGNGIVDFGENCRTCPVDVGVCTAFCGNGKVEEGEDCHNCPVDVPKCLMSCGNGKVESGEWCDDGKANGKNGKCSVNCKKVPPKDKLCGNGVIDAGETCETCAEDLKEFCISGTGSNIEGKRKESCGNGKIEEGEDCHTCPADVGVCTAFCGNGKVEEGEDCHNCPVDVPKCLMSCGNGKVESGEWCDDGKANGKNGKCSVNCKKVPPKDKLCGNGVIDAGETCETCAEDLKEFCISGTGSNIEGKRKESCGNGKIEEGEDCHTCPADVGVCTAFCGNGKVEEGEDCHNCPVDVPKCLMSCGNGKVESGEWCDDGKANGKNGKCSVNCKKVPPRDKLCGNGVIDAGETCVSCAEDLKELCISQDNNPPGGKHQEGCGNGVIDPGETCANCPEDVRRCASFCGNGVVESGEDCDHGKANGKDGECSRTCKMISSWGGSGTVQASPCVSCPCLHTDFVGGVLPQDRIRAKLWDEDVIYRFSAVKQLEFLF